MRKTFYYIAGGALAAVSIPAVAQDMTAETDTADAATTMTAEQQVSYDGWPTEQQTQFDAWPEDVKAYYWGLTPERQ